MTHPFFLQDEVDTYDVLLPGSVQKRDTIYGRIFVGLDTGSVRFAQRWKYHFVQDEVWTPHHRKADPWTDDEEIAFHYQARALIGQFWDGRETLPRSTDGTLQPIIDLLNTNTNLTFSVTGNGEFASKFAGKDLPIEFDIMVGTHRAHYTVNVHKMLPGRETAFRSFVDYNNRSINLAMADTSESKVRQDGKNAASASDFITLPHEFGHAIGYNEDEYETQHASRSDLTSLMNIGREVRPRHFRVLAAQLEHMFPGTKFHI